MLLPSEKEAMLAQLEAAKVPLKPLRINPSKTQPVSPALQALLSKNNDLKARQYPLLPPCMTLCQAGYKKTHPNEMYAIVPVRRERVPCARRLNELAQLPNSGQASHCTVHRRRHARPICLQTGEMRGLHGGLQELAQRALVAYVRSIFLQPNKAVFDASALPAAEYALSMGLTSVPKLRFLKRHGQKKGSKAAESKADAKLTEGQPPKHDSLSAAELAEAEGDAEGYSSEAEGSLDDDTEQVGGANGSDAVGGNGGGSKRRRQEAEEDDISGGEAAENAMPGAGVLLSTWCRQC